MSNLAPAEDFQAILGLRPQEAQILLIGAGTALNHLQRNAIDSGFVDLALAPNIEDAKRQAAHRSFNLIIAELPPERRDDIAAWVGLLGQLSPTWAPAIVCIVATEAERAAVLQSGAHNAWLAEEQAAFPERLAMNARMGLLHQRLVQQHKNLSARIDARTVRLERAIGVLKQAESHLRTELENSKAASRHKSEFIAHISHELRNPLNAISGFAEIMRDQMFGPLGNERYQSHARTIHAASQHLLNIVNGLLDLAKAEAGKLEVRTERVHVRKLVQETVELLAQQATDAGVILNMKLDAELPEIQSDPGKLRQILINLISNAIKFTPTGGRVTISAKRDERSGVMILVVTDTGIGIAPQDLERIMQPFIQAPVVNAPAGTGLGLPITKRFVELLGGTIEVASEAGIGTVFTIRLPLRTGMEAQDEADSASPNRGDLRPPARPADKPGRSQVVLHPIVRRSMAGNEPPRPS